MPQPSAREIIAANVRAELARRGLKQKDLAEHLRINQAGVSARVNRLTSFSAEELVATAAFLGVSVQVLVDAEPTAEAVAS